ncbi:uncharacterized protein LOC132732796 isoform X1 [Ruditapes philippinarum]|uniref:uncharacterized protein LOC132732796 isoform X1 n=2 Tax=Ruditapes philippinarum TaxID=129788 RepID=UPI00295B26AF|nr:uncharacterized protein LOC132732796 isoform X1 [Ruditapes philippinarum]
MGRAMLYAQYVYSLFIVVSLLSSIGSTDASSGLRITVTESTLDMVNQAEIKAFQTDLNGKRFDDIGESTGDLSWKVSNIYVQHVGSMTPSIKLHSTGQITWTCYISSIKVNGRWNAKLSGWLPLSASGDISATISGTSLSISLTLSENFGSLGISLSQCSAQIGNFNLHFSGNVLDGLLNSLTDIFENDLKMVLQKTICNLVSKGMVDISADMKNIMTSFPIQVIGIPLTLDNAFTQIAVSSDTISTYHKGAVHWYDHTFYSSDVNQFPAARTSHGIAFDLKEDVFNNLLKTYVENGNLDGMIGYSRVITEGLDQFRLTCKQGSGGFCFGNIVRQVAAEYPDRVLGMSWSVNSAKLNIQNGQITGDVSGRIYFNVDSYNESLPLFSAAVELTIAFQLKFSAGVISAKALSWGGQVTIDRSSIGKILTPSIEVAVNLFFLPAIRDKVLDIINDFKTEYKIKLPRHVFIKESSLSLFEGVVRIEADLCYKTTSCQTIPNDVWVGSTKIPKLVVSDVIPLPTTTTTTTTSTTSTTSTTTTSAKSSTADTPTTRTDASTVSAAPQTAKSVKSGQMPTMAHSVINFIRSFTIVIAYLL